MEAIEATIPLGAVPTWAVLQRSLFDLLAQAPETFEARFCRPDGGLIWRDTLRDAEGRVGVSSRGSPDRDGGDDFYEPFRSWPLAYVLGGDSSLLERGRQHWEAITGQLTGLGLVEHEYCIGFDWFHQAEGNSLFQFLALASPTDPRTIERSIRFAGLLLNEGTPEPNYDPRLRILRAPHLGTRGPRWGIRGEAAAWWIPGDSWVLERLPFEDVEGVSAFEDLLDPQRGLRMAQAMEERMGKGDSIVNLAATSLATNAFLVSGEPRFRDWVLDYVDGWIERSAPYGGIVPDNVGLSGAVGEFLGGRWYGANYGWTWPHGFFSVGLAVTVAAQNAHLLSGDRRYLEFAGRLIDALWELRRPGNIRTTPMSLRSLMPAEFAALRGSEEALLVPYRYGDSGWFDWNPMLHEYPVALWAASGAGPELTRARALIRAGGVDPRVTASTFTRNDTGHERPWLAFLAGDHPSYPEEILLVAHEQVRRRLDRILADEADLTTVDVDDWTSFNPVTVEALVQLTLGAPAPIYNGGLLIAPIRYFDTTTQRPGLPPGVVALVHAVDEHHVDVELLNLDAAPRALVVQAGVYGEHRFAGVGWPSRTSDYPGSRAFRGSRWYGTLPLETEDRHLGLEDQRLEVRLGGHTRIRLDLELRRNVGTPTLRPA